VILGGGLTGISTAAHLRAPWLLFERDERLGGHARTDERDGYRFDKTGHWLHLRDPAVKKLVDELLPGQMVPIARRARIFSHGVLTRYPYQANSARAAARGDQGMPAGRDRGASWDGGGGGRPRTSRSTACATSAPGSRSTS
jgi:protoporphyrinogen oxidase